MAYSVTKARVHMTHLIPPHLTASQLTSRHLNRERCDRMNLAERREATQFAAAATYQSQRTHSAQTKLGQLR